jgi:hypothetical protein
LGLLSFTNFTTEQLTLRVGEVDGSVWLSDQLELYKNEILVKIAPNMSSEWYYDDFNYRSIVLYTIFIENKVLSINFIEK